MTTTDITDATDRANPKRRSDRFPSGSTDRRTSIAERGVSVPDGDRYGDRDKKATNKAEWRNGRRTGLKILRGVTLVRVRVPPRLLNQNALFSRCFPGNQGVSARLSREFPRLFQNQESCVSAGLECKSVQLLTLSGEYDGTREGTFFRAARHHWRHREDVENGNHRLVSFRLRGWGTFFGVRSSTSGTRCSYHLSCLDEASINRGPVANRRSINSARGKKWQIRTALMRRTHRV